MRSIFLVSLLIILFPDNGLSHSNYQPDTPCIGIDYNTVSHRITKIRRGSSAEKAGLLVGDKIIQIGNRKIKKHQDIMTLILAAKPNTHILVFIKRKSEILAIPVQAEIPEYIKIELGRFVAEGISYFKIYLNGELIGTLSGASKPQYFPVTYDKLINVVKYKVADNFWNPFISANAEFSFKEGHYAIVKTPDPGYSFLNPKNSFFYEKNYTLPPSVRLYKTAKTEREEAEKRRIAHKESLRLLEDSKKKKEQEQIAREEENRSRHLATLTRNEEEFYNEVQNSNSSDWFKEKTLPSLSDIPIFWREQPIIPNILQAEPSSKLLVLLLLASTVYGIFSSWREDDMSYLLIPILTAIAIPAIYILSYVIIFILWIYSYIADEIYYLPNEYITFFLISVFSVLVISYGALTLLEGKLPSRIGVIFHSKKLISIIVSLFILYNFLDSIRGILILWDNPCAWISPFDIVFKAAKGIGICTS